MKQVFRGSLGIFFMLVFLAGISGSGFAMAENGQSFDEDEVFESGLNIRKVEPQEKKTEAKPAAVKPRPRQRVYSKPRVLSRAPAKKSQATVSSKTKAPVAKEKDLQAVSGKETPKDVESNIINSMLDEMEEEAEPAEEKQTAPGKTHEVEEESKTVATEQLEKASDKKTELEEEDGFPAKTDHAKSESKIPFLDSKAGEEAGSVSYLRMIISTLVVVAFIFLFAYLWKMMQTRSLGIFPKNNYPLKVLSQQMIGPRSKIVIIEALGKKYLVGATQERIQLLADLDLFGTEGVPLPQENPENRDDGDHDEDSFASKIFSQFNQTVQTPENRVTSQSMPSPSSTNISEREKAASRIREKLKSLKKFS